jgi:hypothetical protein
MIPLLAIILFIIFLALSGIHFYWGMGGRWAADAAIPVSTDNVKVMHPGLVSCFIVATGLLAMGIFMLAKADAIQLYLPAWLDDYGARMIGILFIMRAFGDFRYVGFFKTIRRTEFARMDTRYYTPFCLLIGVLAIIINERADI